MDPGISTDHPKGRADLVFRQLDDEWVLYDPAANQMHVLNLTASLVWTHCTGEHTADAIAAEVREAFGEGTEADAVRRDVQDAIDRFAREGLLA